MKARGHLFAGLAGALFGAGLLLSGMSQPAKVLGFLHVIGHWDPSLAFVMAGAIGMNVLATRLLLRRSRPWFANRYHLPPQARVDAPLVVGAAIFGVGWGLAGLCPGPAVVDAAGGSVGALTYLVAMIAGFLIERTLTSPRRPIV